MVTRRALTCAPPLSLPGPPHRCSSRALTRSSASSSIRWAACALSPTTTPARRRRCLSCSQPSARVAEAAGACTCLVPPPCCAHAPPLALCAELTRHSPLLCCVPQRERRVRLRGSEGRGERPVHAAHVNGTPPDPAPGRGRRRHGGCGRRSRIRRGKRRCAQPRDDQRTGQRLDAAAAVDADGR